MVKAYLTEKRSRLRPRLRRRHRPRHQPGSESPDLSNVSTRTRIRSTTAAKGWGWDSISRKNWSGCTAGQIWVESQLSHGSTFIFYPALVFAGKIYRPGHHPHGPLARASLPDHGGAHALAQVRRHPGRRFASIACRSWNPASSATRTRSCPPWITWARWKP